MFIPFIVLILVSGILCNPYECVQKERKTCGEFLLPKLHPQNAEDLRFLCNHVDTYGSCVIRLHETCGYDREMINDMNKFMGIINSVCDEDNPDYKVISENMKCIGPAARKLDVACHQYAMSEDNFDMAATHEFQISNNYTREDLVACLIPFWEVSCRSLVLGLHCGSEVKDSVHHVLTKLTPNYEKCTSEPLEDLQPLYETFEHVVEAEYKIKEALKKRK